jgi:hypothetical protein
VLLAGVNTPSFLILPLSITSWIGPEATRRMPLFMFTVWAIAKKGVAVIVILTSQNLMKPVFIDVVVYFFYSIKLNGVIDTPGLTLKRMS